MKTKMNTQKRMASAMVAPLIAATFVAAPSTINAQLLPFAPSGNLYAAMGALAELDVSDLNAVSLRYIRNSFGSEGIAFDSAGNLYRSLGGLHVYDNNFNFTGTASIDDPISDRSTFPVVRRPGQVCACNPVRTPFARLFIFDTSDLSNPMHVNTVNIPFSDQFGGTECRGMAFDGQGKLWVTAYSQIIKLTLDELGNPLGAERFFPGGNPFALAFQPGTGRLFYSRVNENMVSIVDPSNPEVIIASIRNIGDNAINSPMAVVFSSSGDLFVSCFNSGGAETDIVALRASSLVGLAGEVDASSLDAVKIAPPDWTGGWWLAFKPLQNPDSDGDGLLDSTEAELAEANGGSCPDPHNPDSDGDGLSDGTEINLTHTDPCNRDTDGDSVSDAVDPLPLEPGVTCGYLEEITRALATEIDALDLGLFSSANANANEGRRNSLASRVRSAAIAICDQQSAIPLLASVLDKIDGQVPTPDWMIDSSQKAALVQDVELVIALAELLN